MSLDTKFTVYTSAHGGSIPSTRIVAVATLKGPIKPVLLNGIIVDGVYEKTGPYCTVHYEKPKNPARRSIIITPAHQRLDRRGTAKRFS